MARCHLQLKTDVLRSETTEGSLPQVACGSSCTPACSKCEDRQRVFGAWRRNLIRFCGQKALRNFNSLFTPFAATLERFPSVNKNCGTVEGEAHVHSVCVCLCVDTAGELHLIAGGGGKSQLDWPLLTPLPSSTTVGASHNFICIAFRGKGNRNLHVEIFRWKLECQIQVFLRPPCPLSAWPDF